MVNRELEGLFVKLKNSRFWTFIVGVMAVSRILFI
jgi:hypothetical protein